MGRLALVLPCFAMAACGARSQLRVDPAATHADAHDVPTSTACTWTPMGPAVQLSDTSGSWQLEDVALGHESVLAAWHERTGGDVLVSRIGYGGERLGNPHAIAPSGFAAVSGRSTQLAIGATRAAAFTHRADGWAMTAIGTDGTSTSDVFRVALPGVVGASAASSAFTALVPDANPPRAIELATIDDTGTIATRVPLISRTDAFDPVFSRVTRTDGSFLVTWNEPDASATSVVWMQAFDTAGSPRGPQNSFTQNAAVFLATTNDGYLGLWSAPRSMTDPTLALWTQALDATGALIEPASTVDLAGATLAPNAPIASASIDVDMVTAYVSLENGSARLVIHSLDERGHAQQVPSRLSSYTSIGRIALLATPTSAAVVFEAVPLGQNGATQVFGLGLTCLR